jgi:TM2 domain-containing membrane protein YozV
VRNKSVTAVLAFFFGIFGIHRFYLGQYERGALYIVYPIVLVLAILGITDSIAIAREQVSVDFNAKLIYPLLPFLALPVFDTVWFISRSREQFDARYNRKRVRWAGEVLTSLGYILLSCLLVYWLFNKFLVEHKKSVSAQADYTLTADALSRSFAENDTAAARMYDGKIILVTGVIDGFGVSFIEGENVEVQTISLGSDSIHVQCVFDPEHDDGFAGLSQGQPVTIKGRFDEYFELSAEVRLEDCLLDAAPR